MLEPITDNPPRRIANPVIRQAWWKLTFLHWSLPYEVVRPTVPAGLEIDLFEGRAWIGLVPFLLDDFTHPRLPALPWLSQFVETNVRTYVVDGEGKRGVWFYSLDATRLAAVAGARLTFSLPYYWARMSLESSGHSVRYRSVRRFGPPAGKSIEIEFGERIAEPSALESFLSARWRLYAERGGALLRTEVEHPPWPLHRAKVVRLEESLLRAAGFTRPGEPEYVLYSPGVRVLTAWPQPAVAAAVQSGL